MDFKIAVLAGDGIGPEISAVGVDVMTAVCEKFGHKVSYEYAVCGADAIDKVADRFPESHTVSGLELRMTAAVLFFGSRRPEIRQ